MHLQKNNNTQRNSSWDVPYTFSGKEKDVETGYSYFGARYYDSDLSIWLSVDLLVSKYPSMSPYMYTAGNPVMLVDPDGMHFEDPDDEIRAYKSKDKATARIEEYKHRIKELQQNRKNWDKENKAEYKDKKRMVKLLEKHKNHLDEMINSEKIEYAYERVIISKDTKFMETYVRNGKVIMQYSEGSSYWQAHEEAHGHQYLTGELKINRNGGENDRYSDLIDEAKAYQVEYSYRNDESRKSFRTQFNIGLDGKELILLNGVKDIVPNNMVKFKPMVDNYPRLIQKYLSH